MSEQTAMAEAFTAAGYKPPPERLMQCAFEAWTKYPGGQGAGARRDHIAVLLRGELTWRLVEDHAPRALTEAIEALLRRAGGAISAQAPNGRVPVRAHDRALPGEGAIADTKPSLAAPPRDTAARGGQGGGRIEGETHAEIAPSLAAAADKHAAAMRARAATVVRLSKLDTFLVNGQKIGDLTPHEALGWAASRERDVRFVRMLVQNLPLGRPIRESVAPETADELFARAEAGHE